jgi:hypothetical protein
MALAIVYCDDHDVSTPSMFEIRQGLYTYASNQNQVL